VSNELSQRDPGVAPNVDVIILDWNRPQLTIEAIESVLAQQGVTVQVWVVDQGSEPGNRELLRAFCEDQPAVFLHELATNVGVPQGRNIASQLGSAPYIFSLDNDAVFEHPECLSRAVRRFEVDPQLGAIAFRIVDALTGSEDGFWDYPVQYLHATLDTFEVTRFLGGAHGLRRSAFDAAGGYDPELFFGGEERDLAWRVLSLGFRMRYFRDLVARHVHTGQAKFNWSDRRYYFLVRNALYINHKFGAGLIGFTRGAVSFSLRGLRNGVAWAALRAVIAALVMSVRFSLRDKTRRAPYHLSPELRRYIAETDCKLDESWVEKLRRQLTPLPKV